jgi:nucleotide-binding universal stress UspA family protein
MHTRIVVPLDGSDRALAAVGPARRLARLHDAQLWLVTVATPDTTAESEAILTAGRNAAGNPAPDVTVLHGTDAASELVRFGHDHPDALLCLTTRARLTLGRVLFGSVARELVRRSEKAVVLVGPSCDVADLSAVGRLLVCLDGTSEGETILPWATRWTVATRVPIVLVHVVYPLVEPAARVPPSEEQLDELGYVRQLALRLEREGHQVADVTVQHPFTPDAIVDLAADVPGALVAVSTAKASLLTEMIEGSTAAQVVRGSSVPVIVARYT